jgi:hypothetical protein
MVIFAVIDMVAMIFVARTGSMMLMGVTGMTLLVVECQQGIYDWWVLILAVVIAAVWWIMQRAPVI